MTLAIFDLDDTLLCGDSDHAWGVYLVERGMVDARSYAEQNDRFQEDYRNGRLDIHEYLEFQLQTFRDNDKQLLLDIREEFLQTRISPMITTGARDLVAGHREAGRTLIIITSTNEFITRPIADEFGIDILIATELEVIAGQYSGRVSGVPSFREGKVTRLKAWLSGTHHSLAGSWFYTDSHNDIPLLEIVDHPVAVKPDPQLMRHALRNAWQVIHSLE